MIPGAPQAIDATPPGVSPAGPHLTPAEEVFVVRPFRPSDMAYVRDSWLRAAWDVENKRLKSNRVAQKVRVLAGNAWYATNRPAATRNIEAPDVLILVAVDKNDDDHIAGWLAVRAGRKIGGAIKQAYRRDQNGVSWGVGEMLTKAAGLEASW